ncbi:phosphotransferase [Proteiniclasticum sp.]|uniref:phosphotransferase n=1 Tax=Proteiniclasticum sp. TaxID=2053595 RepID=UPI00289AF6FF|nr:phosphotransferase [Proteiniclasticum sp.]
MENFEYRIKSLFEDELKIPFNDASIVRLGGLTNYNYKVVVNHSSYVVRIPGVGTEDLINRHDESLTTVVTNEIGIDAENIYFEPKEGLKVSKYIDDAITLNEQLVKDPSNMKDMAGLFAKLHSCNRSIPAVFDVFDKIVEYENLLSAETENFYWDDYEEVREKVFSLKNMYRSFNFDTVLCHNDPLCENFIKGSDRMYLVDWEYAGMNDPMWDLADVFIEGNFSDDDEALFKSFYFGRAATPVEEKRILMNKVFLDFLWSLWGKQRYSCGEDLLEYANQRYIRAKENMSKIMVDTLVS